MNLQKSLVFLVPMKLVNDERVRHAGASTCTTSTLLLVDVLMHYIDELLMQEVVFVRVLEQKAQQWTFWIEGIFELVHQHFQNFLEILGEQLLQFGLRIVIC